MAAPPLQAEIDETLTRRINRVLLAQEFGWTLDYIDSLTAFDLADIMGVLDGQEKLRRRASRN